MSFSTKLVSTIITSIPVVVAVLQCIPLIGAKYVEGHLKTAEDWAFVARFCFLSGKGRYEYQIEFERRYGEPQLLLYYDDKTQWPDVYKTGKTCQQKLSVLSAATNQIVTLSTRSPFNIHSGCTVRSRYEPQDKTTTSNPQPFPSISPIGGITTTPQADTSYYDQFLKTSTHSSNEDIDASSTTNSFLELSDADLNYTESSSGFNETDLFNSSAADVSFVADTGFKNNLENTTDFIGDVEELFEGDANVDKDSVKNNSSRVRRGTTPFKREKRGTFYVSCSNVGGFASVRERWWYIAIANCGHGKGLDIKYKFRMTNGPPGDIWHEHFSADEMYIPPILLTECLMYAFLLLAVFLCAIELKSRHLFHCTYRLFAMSTMLQWSGVLAQGVAWAKYAVYGLGPNTVVGGLLMAASEVSFLALLLLLAKGYTITRARLSTCSTVKLTVFINLYVIVYISLFVYQANGFDPGEVLNLYESPAGFGLAALRCCSWGVFLCSIIATIRKYPEKSYFYYPFGMLGSLWILAGPILTMVGIGVFDPWVRESVMCGVTGATSFWGHAAFLWLTWPSRANKSFPYHVRTNHVGVIASDEDDGADYPRHTYAPAEDQNVIIPLSRRTEDLINGVYSQYILERALYNSSSTPHSHVSFPRVATAPEYPEDGNAARVVNNNCMVNSNTVSTGTSRTNSQEDNNFNHEIERPFTNGDSQTDSGHLSLENPNSPSETADSSMFPTPEIGNSQNSSAGTIKPNPFVVNGLKRIPHKVILEPIEHPLRNAGNDVPRHLFAAKKTEEV